MQTRALGPCTQVWPYAKALEEDASTVRRVGPESGCVCGCRSGATDALMPLQQAAAHGCVLQGHWVGGVCKRPVLIGTHALCVCVTLQQHHSCKVQRAVLSAEGCIWRH